MRLITTIQNTINTVNRYIKENTSTDELNHRHIVVYAFAILCVGFYLSPLYAGAMTSIKTIDAFVQTLPVAPPSINGITFDPWLAAWGFLAPSMINSAMFTIPATLFSGLLGSFAAYGLTLVNWRGQVAVMVLFVAGVFLPKQAVLIPLTRFWTIIDPYTILANLGPVNVWQLPLMRASYAGILKLIITHTAYGICISTLLFRGYYLGISDDLIEAARLDGANIMGIYRHIILPLSYPMFAVVFIFQFTQIWNELLYGLVVVGGGDAAPVTVVLNELNSGYAQLYNRQTAGAFIAAIPTLLVYLLFGDQFARGVEY